MSQALAHQAEILRLARVLGVMPDDLAFLADAPTDDLADLRNEILDRLLQHSRQEFARAVALADKIPRGLAATLAHRAMGPTLGGRAAALLSPEMAADLAARLPAEFLADVATHVDLRHVGPLVGGIPTQTMAATGQVLRQREEWIVLAAFVGYVPDDKLQQLLELFDGEALLRAGFVIDDVSRLDPVIALLPDARLDELLHAADDHDLWPEAIALVGHLGTAQTHRVIAAIERQPAARLDALLAAIHAHDLWPEALAIASQMPDASGANFLAGIERLKPEQQQALAGWLQDSPALHAAAAGLISRAPRHLQAMIGA